MTTESSYILQNNLKSIWMVVPLIFVVVGMFFYITYLIQIERHKPIPALLIKGFLYPFEAAILFIFFYLSRLDLGYLLSAIVIGILFLLGTERLASCLEEDDESSKSRSQYEENRTDTNSTK